jgi:O-antigen/teichoic acid export membrane protein
LSLRISGALFGFIIAAFIARRAGATVFGQYSLFISMASLFAATIAWGAPNYLSRELPRSIKTRLIEATVIRVCLIAVLLGGLASGLVLLLQTRFHPDIQVYASLSLLVGAIAAISMCFDGTVRGLGGVLSGQVSELLFRPILLIATLSVVFWFITPSLESVIVAAVICYFASFVLSSALLIYFGRAYTVQKPAAEPAYKTPLIQIAVIGVSSWLDTLATQLPLLMIGALANYDDAAAFRLVFYVVPIYSLALKSLAVEDYYRYARAYADDDAGAMDETLARSRKMASAYYALVTIPLLLIGPLLLAKSVGGTIKVDGIAFAALCIGLCVAAPFGTINMRLLAARQERELVVAQIIGLLLTAAAGLILIPGNPVLGAVLAFVLGYCGSKFAMAASLHWRKRRI